MLIQRSANTARLWLSIVIIGFCSQLFAIAVHAHPQSGNSKDAQALQHSGVNAISMQHCHDMSDSPPKADHMPSNDGPNNDSNQGSSANQTANCCEDGCPMMGCHLLSATLEQAVLPLPTLISIAPMARAYQLDSASLSLPLRPPIVS